MPSSAGRVAGAALIVVFVSVLAGGRPASAQPVDDAQELAERYAPIVMLRSQAAACDDDGEPFVPMGVDRILDNPQIALRQVGNGDPTVSRGPSATDLADLGAGFYLDLPGDALAARMPVRTGQRPVHPAASPRWSTPMSSRRPAIPTSWPCSTGCTGTTTTGTTSTRATGSSSSSCSRPTRRRGPGRPSRSSVGYAQHEGGESRGVARRQAEREGLHPVVYSSQRSHASYFSPALYMGRGPPRASAATTPSSPRPVWHPRSWCCPTARRTRPDAGVDRVRRAVGRAARGPEQRPDRADTKPQWTAPVSWQDDLRDSSFVVPGGDTGAAEVVDTFSRGRHVGLHAVHPVRRLPGSHPARPHRPHRRRGVPRAADVVAHGRPGSAARSPPRR